MSSTAPTDEPTDRLHLILGDKRQGDYRRRGLSEIPAPLPAGLRRLDLSHNDLAELRLLSVPSLTELRLHDNLLTSVAMHRAGPLPFELQLLDLSNNRLVALPPSVLQLSSLRMLQLGGQRLRALPRQLSLLSCLAQLEAQDNELDQALVLDAPGLPQLSRLNLSGNRLSNLRLSLDGSIPLLTDLDLSSNKIITWPDALSGLPELRRLSLENNGLRSVRSSASLPNRRVWMPCSALHQLSHLSELNLARNELSELPPEIQPLTELTNLDVRCNPLSDAALSLARDHCSATNARLSSSSLARPFPNIILGDRSAAWHHPTLLRAGVSAIVSVAPPPLGGVAIARLVARHREDLAALGLLPSNDSAAAMTRGGPKDLSAQGLRPPSDNAAAGDTAGGRADVPAHGATTSFSILGDVPTAPSSPATPTPGCSHHLLTAAGGGTMPADRATNGATMSLSTADEAPGAPPPSATPTTSHDLLSAAGGGTLSADRATNGANMSLSSSEEQRATPSFPASFDTSHDLLSPTSLKKAFHAAALLCHPDKLPAADREASAPRFALLKEAYSRLVNAVQVQARALPQFPHVAYHMIEAGPPHLLACLAPPDAEPVVSIAAEPKGHGDQQLATALGGVTIDLKQANARAANAPPSSTAETNNSEQSRGAELPVSTQADEGAANTLPSDAEQAAARLAAPLGGVAIDLAQDDRRAANAPPRSTAEPKSEQRPEAKPAASTQADEGATNRPASDVAQAAAALCDRLGVAANFMLSSVAAGGTVLVHAGELGAEDARVVLTALLHIYLVSTGETLDAASRSLHAAAGPAFLPAAIFDGVKHGFTFTSGPSGLGSYREGGRGGISGGMESLPPVLRLALTEYVSGMAKRALITERDVFAREAGLVAKAAVDVTHVSGGVGREPRGHVKVISVMGSDGRVFPVIVEHAPGARLVSDGISRVCSTAVGE